MISIILAAKIASLFLMILIGFILVKSGILEAGDSRVLSKFSLYAVTPCMILNAFMIDLNDDILQGLILAVGLAVFWHVFFILMTAVLERPLHLSSIEKASVVYSNAGALIIPIVTGVLGSEWVIYTSAYIAVQLILNWTHCRLLLSGKSGTLGQILKTPAIIAIILGILLLFTRLRPGSVIQGTIDSVSALTGPVAMFVTGMLLADMDLKKTFTSRRAWLTASLRLVLLPLIAVAALKLLRISSLVVNGDTIVLISLLAASSSSASNVVQMAQTFVGDEAADNAACINIITTLSCIITMPVIVFLYQM